MKRIKAEVRLKALSPLHLASGQADVNVDAEVIHDKWGMPYFPAKRFKGLLYESALELGEMSGRSGLQLADEELLEGLFHHKSVGEAQLAVSDFFLRPQAEYREMCEAWEYLQGTCGEIVSPPDVLGLYTSVRYQTRLVDGVAAKGSLRNMRVVDAGTEFFGSLELLAEEPEKYLGLIALSLRNLRHAGGKRNRGFGRLECHLELEDGRTDRALADKHLREVAL